MTFNKIDDSYALCWAKKIKAINLLGGKCRECGCKDIFVLGFHHPDNNKEHQISQIKTLRWSILERELEKCELLCSNCHYEKHFINGRVTHYKKTILDSLMIDTKCSLCGYRGKNLRSLSFHHCDKNKKTMHLSWAFARKYPGCSLQDIIDEIKKCSIICMNCHSSINIDKNKFNRMSSLIYSKVKNYKEQNKMDENKVAKMKQEGMGISKIASILGVNKSTIFYVYHKV